MKRISNRIISFILLFSLFVTFFFNFPLSVYAFPVHQLDGTWGDMSWSEAINEVSDFSAYIASQYGAIVNGNFGSYLQNRNDWNDLFNPETGRLKDSVSVDSETNQLTASADFVAYIKQALMEYSEETNGFYVIHTSTLASLDLQQFENKEWVTTISSLLNGHGLIALNWGKPSSIDFCFLDDVYDNNYSFVFSGNSKTWAVLYDQNWEQVDIPRDEYWLVGGKVTFRSLESYGAKMTQFSPNYVRANHGLLYDPGSYYPFRGCLLSSDGRSVRVFKSLDALKAYSLDKRTVYFGSDFYDKEPSDITASWDDIQKTLNGIDDTLGKIEDAVNGKDNLTEDELQKIIDEILGSLDNIGDDINQGSGETNTILGGIADSFSGLLDTLSGYFSSVLAYLESILQAVEALVWIEADESINEDRKDLFDLIDKIWKDPESGSQEAADTISGSFSDVVQGITKKFPFSIPWDIHALFTVFANVGKPEPSAMVYTDSGGIQPYTVDPEDAAQDVHDAPYFVLPLVIESYGINEKLVIDLKDFQTLSALSRSLFAVLFGVFLIKFTISVMKMFSGGVDG